MDTTTLTINNVWMMICTGLVFFMHLGFSFLEIGLTRQKNTINILFKNLFIICIGLLLYSLVGFNLMYPGAFNGVLGSAGIGLHEPLINNSLDLSYNKGIYLLDRFSLSRNVCCNCCNNSIWGSCRADKTK